MALIEDQLDKITIRYDELENLMGSPEIIADYTRLNELAQERNEMEPVVLAYRRYTEVAGEIVDSRALLGEDNDPEMQELAELELEELTAEYEGLDQQIKHLLLPKDPKDDKNAIVEIRAGTGGDEAGLFAGELFRMYARWAENHKFKIEMLSSNETGLGGFKEVVFGVKGKAAYGFLKYESGVHRVQRVPATESQGRIHTSAATVAVLSEADDVEIEIHEHELRIDTFRSSGPGGQSVNTTDSAIRLTHVPSGLVISCQDEKSQLQNRLKAMRILRTRLYDMVEQKRLEETGAARRSQIGSGDRSEKIRTYNFPQSRITDHRINKTVYRLEAVLDGDLDEFIEELGQYEQTMRLQDLDS